MEDPEVIEDIRKSSDSEAASLEFNEDTKRLAAEEAIELMLKKMYDADYFHTKYKDIQGFENFYSTLTNLHNLKQEEGS